MWTIYDHPRDYPDSWVARRWEVGGKTRVPAPIATSDMFVADTLEELRALLPPGLVCLNRLPLDDAKVKEVWV